MDLIRSTRFFSASVSESRGSSSGTTLSSELAFSCTCERYHTLMSQVKKWTLCYCYRDLVIHITNQLTEGFVSEEKRMMACAPFCAFCETALIGKIYHNPETPAANTSTSHDFHTFMSGIGGNSPKGGGGIKNSWWQSRFPSHTTVLRLSVRQHTYYSDTNPKPSWEREKE